MAHSVSSIRRRFLGDQLFILARQIADAILYFRPAGHDEMPFDVEPGHRLDREAVTDHLATVLT